MINTVYSTNNISQPTLLEGPVWQKKYGLVWVDIYRKEVGCLTDDKVCTYQVPYEAEPISTIIFSDDDWLAVNADGLWSPTNFKKCSEMSIRHNFSNSLRTMPKIRTNDGKVGPDGALWIGTMAEPPVHGAGVLYRITPEENGLAVRTIRKGVTISNGIAWVSDGSGFYYIDTPSHTIEFARVSSYGTSKVAFEVVLNIPASFGDPDGMTIDQKGFLYVALWGGGAILVIDPLQKRIMDKIEIPAKYVTSGIFGGPDYNVLYVTTATWPAAGVAEIQPSYDMGGSIFAISDLGTGMPEPKLQLKE